MIVCQCRRVTDREVRAAIASGVEDLDGIARCCGAGSECHGCRSNLEALLQESRMGARPSPPGRRRLQVVAAA